MCYICKSIFKKKYVKDKKYCKLRYYWLSFYYNPYSSNRKRSINKNGEDITKVISYILKLIDIARIMVSLLPNPVSNLAVGLDRINCKYRHDDKI